MFILRSILRNWFLIGLIVLALAAIPGAILVVLALLGMDGGINAWLLENWNITYQLTLSPWLTLILLFLPVFLVLLYFLKLKRKPIQVPSTFLWKKSIEDLRVNSLFQWLRNNILLLIQFLVLLLLIYSVLGLRVHGHSGVGRRYILLIDNSASMSARDVAPSRLDWAKQEALKEIDAASDEDAGMIIVFNSKATTLQTYTNDRGKLRHALRSIEPTQRPTRLDEALALAESLANPARSTEDAGSQPENVLEDQKRTFVENKGESALVHLYSDGRFAKLADSTLANLGARLEGKGNESPLGNVTLRYHMAGILPEPGNTNNLAIVGFNVLSIPKPGRKNAGAPEQQFLAFVRLANYRSSKAEVKLKLDVYIDGSLAEPMLQAVQIPARKYAPAKGEEDEKDDPGETEVKFTLPAVEPRHNIVLHAYLDKPADEFPLDDQAWLAIGTTRKARVLIVGPPNSILDAFFDQEGTTKIARTEHLAAADLNSDIYRNKARSGEFDLILFDRCAPRDEADMPSANTFFIDRPPPPWRRGAAVLKNPVLMPSKAGHPLLRYLTTIYEVRVHEAFAFDATKNLDPKVAELVRLPDTDPKKRVLPSLKEIIETSNHVPLLFTMARGPYTDLVMTFPLISDEGELVTDWSLKTSFPLFLRNVLYSLGNVDVSVRAINVQPGEPVTLRPEGGVSELEITTPKKETIKLQRGPRPEFQFPDTEQVGVYRYRVIPNDGLTRSFAVNLLDANESNIEPRAEVSIGNQRIASGEEKSQPRDIWKWILLVALILLMMEWFIYHQRIAV